MMSNEQHAELVVARESALHWYKECAKEVKDKGVLQGQVALRDEEIKELNKVIKENTTNSSANFDWLAEQLAQSRERSRDLLVLASNRADEIVELEKQVEKLQEQLIAANKGNETTSRKKEAWKEQYLRMASRCDALQAELETERYSALDREHDLLKIVTNHEAYKTLSQWYSEAVDDFCRVRASNLKLLRENNVLKNMLGK